MAVAREVGPSGRVYSNELNPRQREATERAVKAAALANVTVVEGHAADTNLPAGCCDALFMRDVFHHFDDPLAMSRSLLATLAPGGRLGVLDFAPRNGHGMVEAEVRQILERAGFAPGAARGLGPALVPRRRGEAGQLTARAGALSSGDSRRPACRSHQSSQLGRSS